jgi:hypothetical protein
MLRLRISFSSLAFFLFSAFSCRKLYLELLTRS